MPKNGGRPDPSEGGESWSEPVVTMSNGWNAWEYVGEHSAWSVLGGLVLGSRGVGIRGISERSGRKTEGIPTYPLEN
jgi:hypothetical protein